jgi:hypothetical protein
MDYWGETSSSKIREQYATVGRDTFISRLNTSSDLFDILAEQG